MADCVTRLQVLRGTSAQRLSLSPPPLQGELIFDTTLQIMFVGDGITQGGIPFSGSAPVVIGEFTSDQAVSGYDYAFANSASPINFTLPPASTYQKPITIKNKGTGLLNIIPNGSDTIDGQANGQLVQFNAVTLIPSGTEWSIC